jgi:hypothetical protein
VSLAKTNHSEFGTLEQKYLEDFKFLSNEDQN